MIPFGSDTVTFRSSLCGGAIDNPIVPRADRTVTVTFPAVSLFDDHFVSKDYAHLEQSWMFGGPSALTCGLVTSNVQQDIISEQWQNS